MNKAMSKKIRVKVPLTSPGDPLKGHGPQLVPGVMSEKSVRDWLNCYGRLSEANFDFAMKQGWIEWEGDDE